MISRSAGSHPSAAVASLTGSKVIRQEAVAATVFDEVLYQEGMASGRHVSTEQARAMANEQLQLFRADPEAVAAAGIVPPGTDPGAYFLSPRTIAAYQRALTIAAERSALFATFPPSGRAAGVRDWFTDVLTRHSVTLNGASAGFSLVQAFYEGRFVGA